MTTNLFSQHASSCQGLIYSILQNPLLPRNQRGFTAALVAAHPAAGTTYLTTVLAQMLNQDAAESALPLDGRELATLCGDPRTPPENFSQDGSEVADMSRPPVSLGSWSWRGSQDYRALYLAQLRDRFPYVLIDCPSLKESTEVLGVAPIVDGILIVVEANRTQKSQIAYLERTIEGAAGKVLGHLLNKRTYPIPAWLFNRLEQWGA